ncbi:MAG TPA: epoxyqueuosine reductase QueH [Clostridia bacterium]|nr:epoxyqueuosine reductase QueH [Clostridia bacterium]
MNKIDYNAIMKEEIERLSFRPSLLLHVCCAPCASSVVPILAKFFDVDIFYFNPNITDRTEYEKRESELIKLIDIYNCEKLSVKKIKIIPSAYLPSTFYDVASGFESEPEGGLRCERCFYLRLEETFSQATKKNYDYFCTTLTVSPHKNAEIINTIGEELSRGGGAKFLKSDFKKENGYKNSIELSKKYGLYRQNYCGCDFSKK